MLSYPKISILIPLYNAEPFLNTIIKNIETIDYPNCEIIISDRHYLDKAIDILQTKFINDPRVKIVSLIDQINWVDHINELFLLATGKYIIRISQDDILINFPLKEMMEILEENPEVVLCYMPVVLTDMKGNFLDANELLSSVQQVNENDPWVFELTLNAYAAGYFSGAFSGLFRKELLDKYNAYVRSTKRLIDSERLWDAYITLLGKIILSKKGEYIKQKNLTSISSSWVRRPSDYFSNYRVMLSYIRDSKVNVKKKFIGSIYLFFLTLIMIGERIYNIPIFHKLMLSIIKKTSFRYGKRIFSMTALTPDEIKNIKIKLLAYPVSVTAERKFIVRILLRNNSKRCIASYSPNPVHISYHLYDAENRKCILFEGLRSKIIPSLLGESEREFLIPVQAPKKLGSYFIKITLVQESISWFETVNTEAFFSVNQPSTASFSLDYLKQK